MATLAGGRRITRSDVMEEISRLKETWSYLTPQTETNHFRVSLPELPSQLTESLDLFDQAQLKAVLSICIDSAKMAEAGRCLFAVSRKKIKAPNDTDRVRKYLGKLLTSLGSWSKHLNHPNNQRA
jgi:transcriptional regulatory protein RtcR